MSQVGVCQPHTRDHRIVLEKFLDDPARVLEFGRDRLHVLERSLSKRSSPYIETWQRLLDGPRSDIVRLLLSTDEDDVELLKMSPFTTLLNDNERVEVTRRSKLRRADARTDRRARGGGRRPRSPDA